MTIEPIGGFDGKAARPMVDRFDIRPDLEGWTVCDRLGGTSIRDAIPVKSGLRFADADELAYAMSHDPEMVLR
jgi:hypothetical protein